MIENWPKQEKEKEQKKAKLEQGENYDFGKGGI